MPREMAEDEANDLLIASIHEGAHAAACVEFNIPINYAYIKVGRDGGVYIPQLTEEHQISHDDFVLTCLAGPEAQARVEHALSERGEDLDFIRRRVWAQNSRGEDADIGVALGLLEHTTFRSMRRAEKTVRALVTELAPSIESIATELRDQRRLSARQIRRAAA